MEYNIKKYEKLYIERGPIFILDKDYNDIEGIEVGSILILEDETRWEVVGVEYFTNMAGIGRNVSVLTKQI